MEWSEIRKQYPNRCILMGDLKEERISEKIYRIKEGTVLKVSDDYREIMDAYSECKKKGIEVFYTLGTPDDLIVEEVPVVGIL